MSYDYDAIFEAARDENGLLPTLNAQQVLRIVLDTIDTVDTDWNGEGVPPLPLYLAAVRDRTASDWSAILRVVLASPGGGTTVDTTRRGV